jgi:hypothetical protein
LRLNRDITLIKQNLKMRNLLFLAITFFTMNSVAAQDLETLVKKAKKAFDVYNLDPISNKLRLMDGVKVINEAMAIPGAESDYKAQLTKALIFHEVSLNDQAIIPIKKDYIPTEPKSALLANKAMLKAFELGKDKGEKKKASELFRNNQDALNGIGVYNFEAKDVLTAYQMFRASLDLHKLMKDNNIKSKYDKLADYNGQLDLVATAGYNAQKEGELGPIFEEMITNKIDKDFVYEALYRMNEGKDDKKAVQYLDAGRAKFPNATPLLFAEINYYLKKGELNLLIDKLKLAIEKEPSNPSLYLTLGNVYDNMASKETDATKSKALLEDAQKYYNLTIEKDPKNTDALYSIGASYYNKAAALTKDLNALANDYSKEGTKKYDAIQADMNSYFDKALPYFKQAEALNPDDFNTVVALKEIFAKKNDMKLTAEFKTRLENINNKVKNTPYFKN